MKGIMGHQNGVFYGEALYDMDRERMISFHDIAVKEDIPAVTPGGAKIIYKTLYQKADPVYSPSPGDDKREVLAEWELVTGVLLGRIVRTIKYSTSGSPRNDTTLELEYVPQENNPDAEVRVIVPGAYPAVRVMNNNNKVHEVIRVTNNYLGSSDTNKAASGAVILPGGVGYTFAGAIHVEKQYSSIDPEGGLKPEYYIVGTLLLQG